MFRKRVKKPVPPGTFLPTSARVVAIVHLCMAFTLILWFASQPFMGRYFAVKSRMSLFEAVFKNELFQEIPVYQQLELRDRYLVLQEELDISFWKKCYQSLRVVFVEIPVYEQGWLLLSVILPIYLLKRREGSWQAAWLLPILCLAFCVDNRLNEGQRVLSSEEKLFPSEEKIVAEYLSKPLSTSILEQRKQLLEGWNRYLVKEWAEQEDVTDAAIRKGEFLFNVARADKSELPESMIVTKPLSFFVLALYLFWNVYFAWTFFLHRKQFCHTRCGRGQNDTFEVA